MLKAGYPGHTPGSKIGCRTPERTQDDTSAAGKQLSRQAVFKQQRVSGTIAV